MGRTLSTANFCDVQAERVNKKREVSYFRQRRRRFGPSMNLVFKKLQGRFGPDLFVRRKRPLCEARGHKEGQCNSLTQRGCLRKKPARYTKTQADTGLGPVPSGNSFVFKKAKAISAGPVLKVIKKKKEANRLDLCFLLTGSPCNSVQIRCKF